MTAHSLSPKDYIKKLLEVHDIFSKIFNESFPDDIPLAKALDNACGAFININEFALPAGSPKVPPRRLPRC